MSANQQHVHPLTGLDASDPLGYFAALGTLRALHERSRVDGTPAPRLSFEMGARLTPVLHVDSAEFDAIIERLLDDLHCLSGDEDNPRDAFIDFTYEDDKGQPVRDLKPPLTAVTQLAESLLRSATPDHRRELDWLAASLTDVVEDGSGNAAKPFAFHFTAGQQRFLLIANELLDGIGSKQKPGSTKRKLDADDLSEALLGPWKHERELKVFSWSPVQDRSYALRARDPSGDAKTGIPGADWLALRGMAMVTSAPEVDTYRRGDAKVKISTTGVKGGWKSSTYSYPVWPMPLSMHAARSLARHPCLTRPEDEWSRAMRRTLPTGVEILTCRIARSDQGGYGAFSRPSRR